MDHQILAMENPFRHFLLKERKKDILTEEWVIWGTQEFTHVDILWLVLFHLTTL